METKLSQIIQGFSSEASKTTLYSIKRDINHDQLLQTSKIISSMLIEISALKEKYTLKGEEHSEKVFARRVMIELELLLDDLMPERLRAYGDLDSLDEKYMIEKINRLKSMIDAIWAILC